MNRSKTIYKEHPTIIARYYKLRSEFLEYKTRTRIKESGKLPIIMELKCDGIELSCAPMPPREHIIRAKNIMDLFLK